MEVGRDRRGLGLRVEDLAVVVYTTPSARALPVMGSPFKVHKAPGQDESVACVVSSCARIRWPSSDDSAENGTFGMVWHSVFAAREQRHGPLLLRASVAPPALAAALRLATPWVNGARLTPRERWRPRASDPGRPGETVKHEMETADGDVELEIKAGLSEGGEEDVHPVDEGGAHSAGAGEWRDYLLGSRFAFFRLRGGYVWKLPIWAPVTLEPATLVRARLPYWQETGLLTGFEMERPAATFTARPFTVRVGLPHPDLGL